MNEVIQSQLREIRRKIFALKTSKLIKLDQGDKILLRERLRKLDAELEYLVHWSNAQCSIVLELCGIDPPPPIEFLEGDHEVQLGRTKKG